MSATPTASPENFFGFIDLRTVISVLIVIAVAIVAERLISRYLARVAKRLRVEAHVTNSVVLVFRILILIFSLAAIASIGQVQPELLVSISAVGGAAVGFGSQKTIGNFVAGLFLLASRPFRVGDYVRLGTVEGIVKEITINYTKVWTIGDNLVSVSNLQILDRDVTNYSRDDVLCYTFEVGFDHSVSVNRIEEIFKSVFDAHRGEVPKPLNFMLNRSTAFDRVYTVYLYVRKPDDIFKLRPAIAEEVFSIWDKERAAAKA